MNTSTALEITSVWFRQDKATGDLLAAMLDGLLPEPDVWAVNDDGNLLTVTGRSLFQTIFDREAHELSVQRSIITDDGDTGITLSEKVPDMYGGRSRTWRIEFLRPSSGVTELKTTTTVDRDDVPSIEKLLRHVAGLAGWQS